MEPESSIIIAQPGDEEKKRYKVGLTYVGANCWTVMAKSPQEAVSIVSEGGGLPAGKEPEDQVAVQAYEMKEGEKPRSFVNMFLAMLHHMQAQARRPAEGGMIERPSGIVIPEFIPPKDAGG